MKAIFAVIAVSALLLGAQVNAQQTGIWTPLPASQMHGHIYCTIEGVQIYRESNCLIVTRLLEGHLLPFGPDLSARDDIVRVCEERGGFMDSEYQGAIQETREPIFKTSDRFICAKKVNSAGKEQFLGPWVNEAREQLSTATKPRVPMGAATRTNGNNGRHGVVASREFRTTSILVESHKRR